MAYTVLRIAKIKSIGAINSYDKHNDRDRNTPNADKEKLYLNKVVVGEKDKTCVDYFKEKTKDIKIRKNAVYGIEIVLSGSKNSEIWKSSELTRKWIDSSIKWLGKEFIKENVVKVHFHRDEMTPHLHAFIVPMHNGKLNCKHYLGGTKYRLSDYQTSYFKQIEKDGLDLERGIKGSRATHQTLSKFYNVLNEEFERTLPKPRLLESKEKFKMKADKEYQKVVLQNLHQKQEIRKLQSQLYIKKKYNKKDAEQEKKKGLNALLERELGKNYQNKLEQLRKDTEDKKIIKFLDKHPDLKKEIKQIMTRTLNKERNIDRGRHR